MNSRSHLFVALGALALALGAGIAHAQTTPGQYAWEEFGKRIKASEKVSPLGPNFAGDRVSLSNGGLSFRVVDISIPGNGALPVEFTRTYTVFSRKDYSNFGMLADWMVDLPSISGVFTPDWVYGIDKSTQRCSTFSMPYPNDPLFHVSDFWQGMNLSIPGVTESELLQTLDTTTKPSDGNAYRWTTGNGGVHLYCLPSIKNGVGEGFVAKTSNGTEYWFDWMGQTKEPSSVIMTYDHIKNTMTRPVYLQRKKNYLYVTKVRDRFGNEVNYSYGNLWSDPGRLTNIESTDGRAITIAYSGDHISTVTALWNTAAPEGRVWRYTYVSSSSGRPTLSKVQLNDGSEWKIDLGGLTSAEVKYPEFGENDRSCTFVGTPENFDTNFSGRITHPAGATAEFTVDIREHGSSFVPINCRHVVTMFPNGPYKGIDNVQSDDINWYATSANSLTLKQKKVYGPGLAEAVWSYTYEPNNSIYFYPGTTDLWPVCDAANYDCSLPPCTNDDCAMFSVTTGNGPGGEWTRHFHGNTYRYNEGKLLRVESGSGPDSVVSTREYKYDLTRVSGVYPARFGHSYRLFGEGFSTEYHRPQIRDSLVQQGVLFERVVDQFDAYARPVLVTRSSQTASTSPNPPPTTVPAPALTAPASSYAQLPFTVNWTAVTGAVRYELERSINGGAFARIYNGSALSSTMSHLTAASLAFRARACNKYGNCGNYSATQTVRIDPAIVGTPVISLDSTEHGANVNFWVYWTAASGAQSYVLERRVGSGAFQVVYSGTELKAAQIYGLEGSMLYYQVKACNTSNVCRAYSEVRSVYIRRSTGGGWCDPDYDPDCEGLNKSQPLASN